MGELRCDPDLAEESLGAEHRSEFGAKHLHRDLTLVLGVVGEIYRRHATVPELPVEPISAGERLGETRELGGSVMKLGR